MQTEGYVFYGVVALILAFMIWRHHRRRSRFERRRRSLRYDEMAGVYVWTGLDGALCKSALHPDKPGGDWHYEGHAIAGHSGGFDGGGGDFGGGGGD